MRPVTAIMFMSLDGVVQGLGRPDEDTRGGFAHGGWGPAYNDDVMGEELGRGMAAPGDMLLGRRTWEDFAQVWGRAVNDDPFSEHMNAATKCVVSRAGVDVGTWANSVLLRGDAVETVAALKADGDRALSINGSASLVRALHDAGLVDHYTLLIHPVTLGSGTRLFEEPAPRVELTLTGTVTTGTGVVIAHYDRR